MFHIGKLEKKNKHGKIYFQKCKYLVQNYQLEYPHRSGAGKEQTDTSLQQSFK